MHKDLSKFVGVALSSPFAQAIYMGKYDYDEIVDQEGFIFGFGDRVAAAGSVESISEVDRKFADICQRSIEIGKTLNYIGLDEIAQILDEMVNEGTIEAQV